MCVCVSVFTCDSDLDLAIGAPKCVRGSIFRTTEHNRVGRECVCVRCENTEVRTTRARACIHTLFFFRVINTTEKIQAKQRKTKKSPFCYENTSNYTHVVVCT